jgi:hypothetical protein
MSSKSAHQNTLSPVRSSIHTGSTGENGPSEHLPTVYLRVLTVQQVTEGHQRDQGGAKARQRLILL